MPDFPPLPDHARSWALFLDLDGTLLDLADHPSQVVVPAGLPAQLKRLHRALGGALAIVSGRSLFDIDKLVAWAGLDAAGCHGAEFRVNGATCCEISDTLIWIVADRLIHRVRKTPKAFVEVKSQSIALHYSPAAVNFAEIRALVGDVLAGVSDSFHVVAARNVAEIKPRRASKAEAVRRFLRASPYAGRVPVFIGDDAPDEDAFEEVNRRGGHSVQIRSVSHGDDGRVASDAVHRSCAKFTVAGVAELHAWLDGPLLDQLGRAPQSESDTVETLGHPLRHA